MKVQFNAVEEFLTELQADAGLVERSIVRVTKQFGGGPGPFCRVGVAASAIVGGRLVRMDRFVGELVDAKNPLASDREILHRADQIAGQIEQRAQELGLAVRAGDYQA